MITGHSTVARVNEARDAGVNEFLAKPLTARGVIERLHQVVENPRPFVGLARTTSAPTAAGAPTPNYTGPSAARQTTTASRSDRPRRAGAPIRCRIAARRRSSLPPMSKLIGAALVAAAASVSAAWRSQPSRPPSASRRGRRKRRQGDRRLVGASSRQRRWTKTALPPSWRQRPESRGSKVASACDDSRPPCRISRRRSAPGRFAAKRGARGQRAALADGGARDDDPATGPGTAASAARRTRGTGAPASGSPARASR